MLKSFSVICRTKNNESFFSINYVIDIKSEKNIEKSVRAALCEYAATENETIVFEEKTFLNFSDLIFVPHEICEKHGFHVVSFSYSDYCVLDDTVVVSKKSETEK